jgi:hypothetical protein
VACFDVGDERARDPLIVERAVLPEAAVLDRDRPLREPRRDVTELQRLPVRLRRDDAEQRAVPVEDERVLAERDRPQVGEAARVEQDRAARDGARGDRADRDCGDDGKAREDDPAAPWTARATARAGLPQRDQALQLARVSPLRTGA